MTNKYIVIDIHSFIDVITNSSTELFIVDTEKSIDTVKELLQFMCDKWNELALGGAFGDQYLKNKRAILGNTEYKAKPIKTFDDMFGIIRVYTQVMYEEDSGTNGWGYEKEENIGKIIIESAYDNSIPYEMFSWIESAFGFDTQRFHLG